MKLKHLVRFNFSNQMILSDPLSQKYGNSDMNPVFMGNHSWSSGQIVNHRPKRHVL